MPGSQALFSWVCRRPGRAVPGAAVLPLLLAATAAPGWHCRQRPQPAALIVLVADLQGAEAQGRLVRQAVAAALADGPPVEVAAADEVPSGEVARQRARQRGARLVLWGGRVPGSSDLVAHVEILPGQRPADRAAPSLPSVTTAGLPRVTVAVPVAAAPACLAELTCGLVWLTCGRYAPAAQALGRALELQRADASDGALHFCRGNAEYLAGSLSRALADFDRAVALDPDRSAYRVNRGNVYFASGEYGRAVAEYDEALRRQPADPAALSNRGKARFELGDAERALLDLDRAVALDTAYSEAYTHRGDVHLARGQAEAALADFDRAVRLDTSLIAAYRGRILIRSARGEYAEALADYDRVIALKPDDPESYHLRGLTYAQTGAYERAVADYDRALSLRPGHARAYYNRGNARFRLGDFRRAIADYDEAIRLRPGDVRPYFNRGKARQAAGERRQAAADFGQVLALSDDPQVRRWARDELESGALPAVRP